MKQVKGNSTFTIPEDYVKRNPEAKLESGEPVIKDGKIAEIPFTYDWEQCENEQDARDYFAKKLAEAKTDKQKERWSFVGIANRIAEGLARSAKYSFYLQKYATVKVAESQDEIDAAFEKAVKGLLELGLDRETAEGHVRKARMEQKAKSAE